MSGQTILLPYYIHQCTDREVFLSLSDKEKQLLYKELQELLLDNDPELPDQITFQGIQIFAKELKKKFIKWKKKSGKNVIETRIFDICTGPNECDNQKSRILSKSQMRNVVETLMLYPEEHELHDFAKRLENNDSKFKDPNDLHRMLDLLYQNHEKDCELLPFETYKAISIRAQELMTSRCNPSILKNVKKSLTNFDDDWECFYPHGEVGEFNVQRGMTPSMILLFYFFPGPQFHVWYFDEEQAEGKKLTDQFSDAFVASARIGDSNYKKAKKKKKKRKRLEDPNEEIIKSLKSKLDNDGDICFEKKEDLHKACMDVAEEKDILDFEVTIPFTIRFHRGATKEQISKRLLMADEGTKSTLLQFADQEMITRLQQSFYDKKKEEVDKLVSDPIFKYGFEREEETTFT